MKLSRMLIQMVLSFLCICFGSHSKTKSLNFDQLFPETPLESVLDQCMCIQRELEVCGADVCRQDKNLFVDLLVGKLFHLHSCMQVMVKNKIYVHQEDARYLLRIIEKLCSSFNSLFPDGLPDRGEHVLTLLKQIKQGLVLLQ